MDYEREFETQLAKLDNEIILDAAAVEPIELAVQEATHLDSDMDGWDYVICATSAAISAFISTNEAAEKWLAKVHDAASNIKGDYDPIQKALGALLEHQGDRMDRFYSRTESEARPWIQFHRLLYGHDPLAKGEGFEHYNPFIMMHHQENDAGEQMGIAGIFQAARHLIADTFSKQGLPLPGSSYLDCDTEDGKPWNHLINVVQQLSQEQYGNKSQAEPIYEHLLTIRAQDVVGGMSAKIITSKYIEARHITDEIRVVQIRLVAYTMSFYAQALVGASKQNGIPYINYPLGAAMGKEMAALLIASNKKTWLLNEETKRLNARAGEIQSHHDQLRALMLDDFDYYLEEGTNER